MPVSFTPNPDFREEMLAELRPQLREIAEEVADIAAGNLVLPEGKSGPVLVLETENGYAVSNVGPLGHIDEWGSVNNPPYAPLRRAIQSAGLDFVET